MIDKKRLSLAKGEKLLSWTKKSSSAFFVEMFVLSVVTITAVSVGIWAISSAPGWVMESKGRMLRTFEVVFMWLGWWVVVLMLLWCIAETIIEYTFYHYAVTTRRVVKYWGWIGRYEEETFLHKVESIDTKQGIIARIFGYGSVKVCGTGGAKFWVCDIPNHRHHAKKMTGAIRHLQKAGKANKA